MARNRLLVLAAVLFFGMPYCAADPPKCNVKVSIIVIIGSEHDEKVDPKLKCIADEVGQAVDPKLKGFRMVKMACLSIPPQGKETFDLLNDQKAIVQIEQPADKDNRVTLKLTPPLMNEITYTTCCGKFLPVVTRYRPNPGELLIFAVRVQPCNGK
jgi:hypothetical protein